jgi:hypothetical protein
MALVTEPGPGAEAEPNARTPEPTGTHELPGPPPQVADGATEPPPRPPSRDPQIPEGLRNVIPPAPRGWSDEEWRESFLGKPGTRPTAGSVLGTGRGWLVPVLIGVGFLVVIVVVLLIVK